MSAATEPDRDLLETLVSLGGQAEALERLMERLSSDGLIGSTRPAGAARTAMIAAALALEPTDLLLGTARDLPGALAHGVTVEAALRQAYGVSGDTGRGRGLPGAICDRSHGVTLTDGSPAAHLVHAAGFGHAARLRGDERVALGLFGSGAQGNGELHAALNFAAVYQSQTIFVARGALAGERPLEEGAEAWGLRVLTVDGYDGRAVHRAVRLARAQAIDGEGPTLVDARLVGEAEPWDWRALRDAGGWSSEQRERTRQVIAETLRDGRNAAEGADPIEVESLLEDVLSDRPWFLGSGYPAKAAS